MIFMHVAHSNNALGEHSSLKGSSAALACFDNVNNNY